MNDLNCTCVCHGNLRSAFFPVSFEDLAAVNGFTLDDFLHPGDVLVIPQ